MTGAEIAVVIAAVMAGSLVKSVTGMGLPAISVTVIALFVGVEEAVVVMALPGVVSNAILAAREVEHRHETRDIGRFCLASVVGAVAGTLLLVSVPEEPLLVALIGLVVFYVITALHRPDFRLPPAVSHEAAPYVGVVAGLAQGSTGISGPVVVTWFHSYRLPREAHILTITFVFLIGSAAQLATLIADGELTGRWTASLAAVVPTVAMIPVGTALRSKLSGRAFDLAVVAVLGLAGLGLVVRLFS